jgi:hypothetical protein
MQPQWDDASLLGEYSIAPARRQEPDYAGARRAAVWGLLVSGVAIATLTKIGARRRRGRVMRRGRAVGGRRGRAGRAGLGAMRGHSTVRGQPAGVAGRRTAGAWAADARTAAPLPARPLTCSVSNRVLWARRHGARLSKAMVHGAGHVHRCEGAWQIGRAWDTDAERDRWTCRGPPSCVSSGSN